MSAHPPALSREQLDALRRLDSCTVSNAIERFNVRLRNEGFADSSIRCLFERLPPMVGYAATVRIRCSGPPPSGHKYFDRTDWWDHLLAIPEPRVVVIQDLDATPGLGSIIGEVHATILRALGCVGAVTNSAVRDLPPVEALGFSCFAAHVVVSHAYVHIVDFGGSVEVGGLQVRPGDLLHGDRHGVISVPLEIAAEIPAAATEILEREQRVIKLCNSPDFSIDKLRRAVKDLG